MDLVQNHLVIMKQRLIAFLLPLFLCVFANKASAYDAKVDGIYYLFSGTNATVTYLLNGTNNTLAYFETALAP